MVILRFLICVSRNSVTFLFAQLPPSSSYPMSHGYVEINKVYSIKHLLSNKPESLKKRHESGDMDARNEKFINRGHAEASTFLVNEFFKSKSVSFIHNSEPKLRESFLFLAIWWAMVMRLL